MLFVERATGRYRSVLITKTNERPSRHRPSEIPRRQNLRNVATSVAKKGRLIAFPTSEYRQALLRWHPKMLIYLPLKSPTALSAAPGGMLLGLQPFSDDACGNDALLRVDVPVGGADERPECPELSRRPLVRRHNEKHSLDLPQWEAPYLKYKVPGIDRDQVSVPHRW